MENGKTIKEIAELIGQTTSRTYEIIKKGKLRSVRLNFHQYLVTDKDIEDWKILTERKKQEVSDIKDIHKGQRINGWTVITTDGGENSNGEPLIVCQCTCGKIKLVKANDLITGKSRGCGCKYTERINCRRKYKTTDLQGIWYCEEDGTYKVISRINRKGGIIGIFNTKEEAIQAKEQYLKKAGKEPTKKAAKPFISPTEVAKLIQTRRQFICQCIEEGTIPAKKIGNRWELKREDVEKCREKILELEKEKKTNLQAGDSIGCWTVLRPNISKSKNDQQNTECQCICGKIREIKTKALEQKLTMSCGCKHNEYRRVKIIYEIAKKLGMEIPNISYNDWLFMDERKYPEAKKEEEGILYIPAIQKYLPEITTTQKRITRLGFYDSMQEAQTIRQNAIKICKIKKWIE